jgi:hypothetical protein
MADSEGGGGHGFDPRRPQADDKRAAQRPLILSGALVNRIGDRIGDSDPNSQS